MTQIFKRRGLKLQNYHDSGWREALTFKEIIRTSSISVSHAGGLSIFMRIYYLVMQTIFSYSVMSIYHNINTMR